ncbi:ribonuclease Z [Alkalihalobacterium alkalinitrilicum]|uniref:ribonuclease Z n=1 Tax=Alkalihalobacterium alkalinitrilicum TaxID=427920 RepID=UPI000994E81C|nr:ribonuclease Z [Alkalihalobacterium alkalinitrilicum]
MEFHFLGTGAGVPSTKRNVSSLAIRFLQKNGSVWMVDCGEGTQQQILRSSLKLSKLEKIFITHLHGDHIFGLPGLLGSRSFQGGKTPLTIYGPKGIKTFIEQCLSISKTTLLYPLHIHEIKEGLIFEDEMFIVHCLLLDHVMPSFGFRIEEKSQSGELLVHRLKEKGIEAGPIYKNIKAKEKVQLPSGEWISGADYVGPDIKGRVVTIVGDTKPCEKVVHLAKSANILIHEATFSKINEALAHQYGHSTASDAAQIARAAKVELLILNHISARYEGKVHILEEEAREIFPNSMIACDFFVHTFLRENE